jgi:hypothetical protein
MSCMRRLACDGLDHPIGGTPTIQQPDHIEIVR